VRLALYDALGRERAVLDAGMRDAGTHFVAWDGRDGYGQKLPAGTFFLHLRVGAHSETQKLIWLP
jgi:hypothetical protein